MPKQLLLRAVCALSAMLALVTTAHEPEADDIPGPPLFTSAGCRGDQPFTVEYVAKVLNVDSGIVKRMLKRYGLHPWQVCALDARRIAPLIAATRMNKFGYDEPDEGLRYRRLSYVDESGTIKPNGIGRAAKQRKQNADAQLAKGKMAKAAGVSQGSWAALGPFNVGGRVRAIAPHPTIPNRILLGSVAGGIFRTTDGGANWTSVNDYLPSVAISSIVHDPANPNVVYAGTGEGYFNIDAMRGVGILKSTDAGDTWAAMPSTDPMVSPPFNYVNRIAIDPSNSQVILAATRSGVMRSADGGATWTQPTTMQAGDVRFDASGARAVAGEWGAVVYSTDHGATWTRVGVGGGRAELAYSASTGNWFLQLDLNGGQVFKSTNGGASWTFLSQPGVLGNQGWYDNAIWVDPINENRILVGGASAGMKMSVDGGMTFTSIGSGVHPDHHIFVHDPGYASNGVVYNGNDGGIYKFTGVNNVTTPQFSPPNPPSASLNNLSITQFYGGAGGAAPVARVVGGTQDNGSLAWVESTNRWTQIAASDGGRNAVQQNDTAYLYGEFQWLAIFRSTNGGADTYGVEMICAGIADSDCSGNPKNANFISPMALDPANPDRLYAGGASLWRSDNVRDAVAANVRWTRIKAPGAIINAIAVAPSNPNVVWVGDNDGNLYRTMDATSGSPTWSANLSPISGRQVMRILVDSDNPARVYATYAGYIAGNVRMTANGLDASPAWSNRSGTAPSALPDSPVRALARHPLSADWIYAGTEVGLFASQDGGLTWSTTNDGPGTVSIEDLFFLDATRLVAATHGRGMYMGTVAPPAQAHGTLQLSATTLSLVEGQAATLQVTRTGGANGAVGATIASVNGTATAGGDFIAVNQTLTWGDGDSSPRTIQVQALADTLVEGNETFSLALSGATGGATLGTPSSATVTISDPDAFPVNCAMPSGWTVPAGANGWSVDAANAMEGRCSLRSNAIGNGQEARIEYTASFGAGNVTFSARVDSEPRADCLHFLVDGAERDIGTNCTSGGSGGNLGLVASTGTDTGWRSFSFPITAGTHTLAFAYRKNASGTGGADAAWIDNVALPAGQSSSSPVTFIGAYSRKSHAAAGTFDLPIDATQPIQDATIESRSLGSGHRIGFQFSNAIASSGTVSIVDESGAAFTSFSTSVSGNAVEVTLTGIADNRRVTISLSNVNGQGVNASASVGFLEGDVDGSGTVTASDVLRAKGKSGQAVGAATFMSDVDTSGAIDAADVLVVKQRAGLAL